MTALRAARAVDCRCALTTHLFAHSVSRHFDYSDEEGFRRAHAELLASLGAERAGALLAELAAESRRRSSLEEDARSRTEAIRAGWRSARPELYTLQPSHLDPRFIHLAELARSERAPGALAPLFSREPCRTEAAAVLLELGVRRLDAVLLVYEMPVLAPKYCEALCAELADFERSGLPSSRPNSMNRHGLLLSELGFSPMLDALLGEYVAPLAAMLFPEAGGGSLDTYRAFTVKYTPDDDPSLALHFDNAEVTLNVCIGERRQAGSAVVEAKAEPGFEGGELLFGGLNSGGPQTPTLALEHSVGRAVLHLGKHMHQALPVSSGTRINLVVWCRSSAIRRCFGCPMCGRKDQLLDPADTE
ncbi:hypothetical protein T492DRAFT_602910 [Pavlovales sp. CCMP2436]|nr:hypothetical protein T492DRAFT_602910 [Pavlovales sp. CCMP2436]